jgi:putative colanic acid biosynthesis UDP-glucose lipid carrier transferase
MKKWVQFDLPYIQNWSLMMDLRILTWTTFNSWVGKNVY